MKLLWTFFLVGKGLPYFTRIRLQRYSFKITSGNKAQLIVLKAENCTSSLAYEFARDTESRLRLEQDKSAASLIDFLIEFKSSNNERLDKLDARLDKLDARLDKLDARFDKLDADTKEGSKAIKASVDKLDRDFFQTKFIGAVVGFILLMMQPGVSYLADILKAFVKF